MKSLVAVAILIVVVIGGYFLINKPINTPAPEDTNASDEAMGETEESVNEDASINGTKEFDTSTSSAEWTGTKTLIKDYNDTGTINIKSGNAVFAKGVLTGGTVVFDMNSISTTSTGMGDESDKLSMQAKHMMSADFFDSAKYPEAKFVITSASRESAGNYILSGDLTVKGVTNPVSFPAMVTEENGKATVSGTATIDRTLWGVKYGSDKFFKDLGDKVIGDTFTLEFEAVTK